MNKIMTALVGLALIVLTACAAPTEERTEPKVEAPSVTETVTPTPEPEAGPYDLLREEYPYFNDVPDSLITSIGESTCTMLEIDPSVATIESIGMLAIDNEIPAEEAGAMIGTVILNDCPEYAYVMDEFVNKYGGQNS